jgi:hypothetical protein
VNGRDVLNPSAGARRYRRLPLQPDRRSPGSSSRRSVVVSRHGSEAFLMGPWSAPASGVFRSTLFFFGAEIATAARRRARRPERNPLVWPGGRPPKPPVPAEPTAKPPPGRGRSTEPGRSFLAGRAAHQERAP